MSSLVEAAKPTLRDQIRAAILSGSIRTEQVLRTVGEAVAAVTREAPGSHNGAYGNNLTQMFETQTRVRG